MCSARIVLYAADGVPDTEIAAKLDNEAGVVTISIGAAACPQGDQSDPTDAIHRADRALCAAKAQGRNRVVADR